MNKGPTGPTGLTGPGPCPTGNAGVTGPIGETGPPITQMAHKVSFAMMHDPEFDPTDSLASLLGVYLSHIPASMMEEPIRAFYYKHMRKIQAKQRERAQRSMPWLPDYE